jgi:hypothetical protein
MRSILPVFILCTVSCTNNGGRSQESDVTKEGLKGKVKTLIEFSSNKLEPAITLKRVYRYDEYGMRTTYYEYVNEQLHTKSINTFDGQGIQTRRMFYQFRFGMAYNIIDYRYKNGYEDKSLKPSVADSMKIVVEQAADTMNLFFGQIHNETYIGVKGNYFRNLSPYRETSSLFCLDPHPGIEPQPFDSHGNWTREVIVGRFNDICTLTERFFEYY